MKKMFLFLGILTLVGFNVLISRKSEDGLKITVEFQNVALANYSQSEDKFGCYTSFAEQTGGSVLKCNTPCCYYKDHISNGAFAGSCTGSFSNCAD